MQQMSQQHKMTCEIPFLCHSAVIHTDKNVTITEKKLGLAETHFLNTCC